MNVSSQPFICGPALIAKSSPPLENANSMMIFSVWSEAGDIVVYFLSESSLTVYCFEHKGVFSGQATL